MQPHRFASFFFAFVIAIAALHGAVYASTADWPTGEDLGITGITPAAVPNDTNMPVTIQGSGFSATPTVRAGDTLLTHVTWKDAQTLTATVPWGMQPGTYPITVANPGGAEATLPAALTVTGGVTGWTSNGPYGGQMVDVAVDPHNPQAVYANAWSSGMFASASGGSAWNPMVLDPMPTGIRIQYDGAARRMYVGLHADMQRSLDNGATWERFIPDEVDQEVRQQPCDFHPEINPLEPGALYLGVSTGQGNGAGGGLFKYRYDTQQWQKLYPQDIDVMAAAFDPENAQILYFGTRQGLVFKSINGGQTWSAGVQVGTHISRLLIDPFKNAQGHYEIWATTSGLGFHGEGVYRSVDDGATFQHVDNLPNNSEMAAALAFQPNVPGVIYVAADAGYYTTDSGATWQTFPGSLPGVTDIAVSADAADPTNLAKTILYAATNKGIYRSPDGGQHWEAANQGLAAVVPESIAVNPANPDEAYASTFSLDILKTVDGGRTWQPTGIPFAGWRGRMAVDPFQTQTLYFGCSLFMNPGPCLGVSDDAGATYRKISLEWPAEVPTGMAWSGAVLAIAPDPTKAGRILVGVGFSSYETNASAGAIYRTDDGGQTWSMPLVTGGLVRFLAFSPHDPALVLAGTDEGLRRSVDSGAHWTRIQSDLFPDCITAVAFHPDQPQTIYAYGWVPSSENISKQGIYLTTDGGTTWDALRDGNGNQVYGGPVWEMAFTPLEPHLMYIATFDGLYQSSDGGHTLVPVGGLPGQANAQALALGVEANRLVIYAGTTGGYRASPAAPVLERLASAEMLGAGIYRSVMVFQRTFLPIIKK